MKLVVAVIQPTKLNAVREALEKVEVARITICDGQGYGRRPDRADRTILRKIVLEIIVNDDFLDRTVETIRQAAHTGPGAVKSDDGQVFIMPTEQAIQINDGFRGPGAV